MVRNKWIGILAVSALLATGLAQFSTNGTTSSPSSGQGVKALTKSEPKVQASALDKNVNLRLSASHQVPENPIEVRIQSKNLRTVTLDIYSIGLATYLAPPSKFVPSGKPLKSIEVQVADAKAKPNAAPQDTYYYKTIKLPKLSTGLYMVGSRSASSGNRWQKLTLSNLATIAKRSHTQTLGWVTDIGSGKPLPGVTVGLYEDGKLSHKSTTNADGLVRIVATAPKAHVVFQKGTDISVFATGTADPNGNLVAHFQTDRPIYRPGQKVNVRATLRRTQGIGYKPVSNEKATISWFSQGDILLQEDQTTTSELGTVSGNFEIPRESGLGFFWVQVKVNGQTARFPFEIQAYRKPEFKVAVTPLQKRALAGETINFTVNAKTYFDSPVGQAQVNYQIIAMKQGGYWQPNDYDPVDDGTHYDSWAGNEYLGGSQVFTDNQGNANITVQTRAQETDAVYTLKVTVTDGARRTIDASASTTVYASQNRLSLRVNASSVQHLKPIPFTISLVDLDGKPAKGNVSVRLTTEQYNEKKKVNETISTKPTVIPVEGVKTASIAAEFSGSVTVVAEVKDATNRKTTAFSYIYVVGAFDKVYKEQEYQRLTVSLDKKNYKINETIRGFVTTNRKPGAGGTYRMGKTVIKAPANSPILLVWEGHDILEAKVHYGTGTEANLTAKKELFPNVYLTSYQWVQGQQMENTANAPILDPDKRITVKISADKKEYRPGDPAELTVKATDQDGKPLETELTLSVVDEAIFALRQDMTLDPYAVYWAVRPSKVNTYSSAPVWESAGAMQDKAGMMAAPGSVGNPGDPPVRARFEDTALWTALVKTDTNGTAHVKFDMPGNLTTWRATGIAFDANTRTGKTTSAMLSTRPVTLRLATPRHIVEGDSLKVIGTVNNRSDQPHNFDVEVTPDNQPKMTFTVSAAAKSDAKFEFDLKGPEGVDSIGILARVKASGSNDPDLGDALKQVVPVSRNGLPERFVFAGVTEANAKQFSFDLPSDSNLQKSSVWIRFSPGFKDDIKVQAEPISRASLYGTLPAIARLRAAALLKLGDKTPQVREVIAFLARDQRYNGWGYWDQSPGDPFITAHVLMALQEATEAGITVPDNLLAQAIGGTRAHYNQTNLWDARAILVAALLLCDKNETVAEDLKRAESVLKDGQSLSPYARYVLARGLVKRENSGKASKLVEPLYAEFSLGAPMSYLPVGQMIGWRASELQTNAEAVRFMAVNPLGNSPVATFANYISAESRWTWDFDEVAVLVALSEYSKTVKDDEQPMRPIKVTLNGKSVTTAADARGFQVAEVPADSLALVGNKVDIDSPKSYVRYTMEVRTLRPAPTDNVRGVRVLRRFEIQNTSGAWVEAGNEIPVGKPVKATVLVWGDPVSDLLRITEPVPAGFEVVDQAANAWNVKAEVRDDSVVHYIAATGAPITIVYYLRSESTGQVKALPAWAEVIRRPQQRGNTSPLHYTVGGGKE